MDSPVTNPTADVDLDFSRWVENRQRKLSEHLADGVPDYSFSLDRKLRQRIEAMGPLRLALQRFVSFEVPIKKQKLLMDAVRVSPTQYPEIFSMGEDCANTLGIGVPQIFIRFDWEMNAETIATDDIEPVVCLNHTLVEALTPTELLSIIGHECGHIHNLHGVHATAVGLLAGVAGGGVSKIAWSGGPLAALLSAGIQTAMHKGIEFALQSWSRAGEITCDRAGLICCQDVEASCRAMVKLQTGGGGKLADVNIDEYLRQMDDLRTSPVKFRELTYTHPIIPKRIAALQAFAQCEVLYSWRPEMRSLSETRSISDVDAECEDLIRVVTSIRREKSEN